MREYRPFMFGIIYLNIFQYVFERKGFEFLSTVFCQIENDEFLRNSSISNSILIRDMLIKNKADIFPFPLPTCSIENQNEMSLLKKAYDMKLCIVRGIEINGQITNKFLSEINGQSNIKIVLSQDTEQIVYSCINLVMRS